MLIPMFRSRILDFLVKALVLMIPLIGLFSQTSSAEFVYSGLIGGIDRGDGAALPTLGLKLAFDAQSGVEITYARGAIKSEGLFLEKERLLTVGYRKIVSNAAFDPFLGIGVGIANAVSEAQGRNESVNNPAVNVSAGLNWMLSTNFGLKTGVDAFVIPVGNVNPIYAIGIRNFWYLGIEVIF